MNRITLILTFLFILGLPAVSAGEGTMEIPSSTEAALPVSRVTLYTAGLAHIVHETTVTGDETLYFPVEYKDMDDILKSLVIEDLGGGMVDAVNFDSGDPLAAALEDMRVNPSGSPGLFDFLLRTQGELVTVTTPYGVFTGRIFSVEKQEEEEESHTQLNLMDSGGIRSVDISQLQNLSFDDPLLQQEMNKALSLIAQSRVKSTRLLKLSLKGEGTRTIRLSYIRAVPLWKTSYRIVLDQDGVPRLEGWALVQNTATVPWSEVQLGFAAGSPNAFTMDLSTPRYVQREERVISPGTLIGGTEYDEAYIPDSPRMAKEYLRAQDTDVYSLREEADGNVYDLMEKSYEPAPVSSRASGIRAGNFYRYDVKTPVTVGPRSSAMIPIIQEKGIGRVIGVYDPVYDLVFKGIRLENSSEAHWAAGPVTVLEGRNYGGDALLPDMIPGSERILTYAVHGTLSVQKSRDQFPREITSLKILDGVLYRTDKMERETVYRIQGSEKELILLHPKEEGWKLTEHPPIDEETKGEFRFVLKNWDDPVTVREEYTMSQQFSLSDFRIQDFSYYMEWDSISPAMNEAFKEISRLKSGRENIVSEISLLNTGISRMERDQNRVRENMKVLDKESDLYIQYSRQLGRQEEEIQRMNSDIDNWQNKLREADGELKEYIRSLEF